MSNDCKEEPVRPSIVCDEPGCNEIAMWKIRYWLDDEEVVGFSCDHHIHDNMDSDGENRVRSLGG